MEKYIVITGGQLYNKGAEAMTYVAVDELTKRYPDHKMVVLSTQDYKRSEEEKKNYKFEILPRSSHILFTLASGELKRKGYKKSLRLISRLKNPNIQEIRRLKTILKKTTLMVDISGFALSSQFSEEHCLNYLSRIIIARDYNIPFYIMPQSFGPFEFSNSIQNKMMNYIKETLKYPTVVYAREKEGYEMLKNEVKIKENLEYSLDSVLLNKGINLQNVFYNNPVLKKYPGINGVAIVPNMKTFEHGNKDEILEIYDRIIKLLLGQSKNVYIVRHSFEDIEACEMIKNRFKENESVVLITEEMSCLDFDELVKEFDFLIGSRFHSIVHAYKNYIPSISLGWATKYQELLDTFSQSDYIFDVRNSINIEKLLEKVEKMNTNYERESHIIKEKMQELQGFNPYDSILKIKN